MANRLSMIFVFFMLLLFTILFVRYDSILERDLCDIVVLALLKLNVVIEKEAQELLLLVGAEVAEVDYRVM